MTREEAIDWLKAISFVSDHNILEALDMAIEALQTDVVRCKDCKFKRLYDEGDTKYYYCALEDRPNRNWSVDDDDFCAWAERKGGDAE